MAFRVSDLSEVERFIVTSLPEHPQDIAKLTANQFSISRQAVSRYLQRLVAEGVMIAHGETQAREYTFAVLAEKSVRLRITPDLGEDVIWREEVVPQLSDVPSNVIDICRYGVTEIINNAIEHSGSPNVGVSLTYMASGIKIMILDEGIGIFRKIKEGCGLDDERHAILELAKGKLTTDPERHTGEGIFFTSRMFDAFAILSGHLYVSCSRGGGDWLLEDREHPSQGTSVHLTISPLSSHTTNEVFERYATDQDDYAFSRTHVVVALAQQAEGDKLVSRSQAKRVLARLDRFREVVLDFRGIEDIGPAFADEIFRVFQREHSGTRVSAVNTNENVDKMIRRALATASGSGTTS